MSAVRRTTVRRLTAAAALLLAAAVSALCAAPAYADGYRYWSFWDRDGGGWAYAAQGPATAVPGDGEVQGFRFSVSTGTQDAAKPRGPADFDAICGGTPARDGAKRVALVLDFGTAADAPEGESPPAGRTECASVPADASSGEALAAVAKPLRYGSSALLCAIAGYPETGCGEQTSDDAQGTESSGTESSGTQRSGSAAPGDTAAASEGAGQSAGEQEDGGPSAGLYAGIAVVAVIAAAAIRQARRRG